MPAGPSPPLLAAMPSALSVPPRYNVLGVGISALTLAHARDLVLANRGRLRRGYICLATAHGLTEAQRDPALKTIYNRSWLTTPDGMPLVWLGPPGVERVYGPDLMLAVCDAGRAIGLRHYFYGGEPGVAAALHEKLAARFPGLDVVGTFTPPFRPLDAREAAALRADIAHLRPDVIWVGLSSPKQEKFMAAYADELEAGVMIGVGAAFDFHSGRVRQAPRFIQRSGFEWLFRLCAEPRRLGKRYLTTTPLFALRVLVQKLGWREYPLK
ncbi:MAG: glycosyltransferase [Opitutia bacterium Tous-C1TDCM]|nr:MAG: glycosyltransferase [Opitutae bacterium Tous-C1TDCM]